MPRSTEDMHTEDAALREIARDPGDYYAGKAADAAVLREALALAEQSAHPIESHIAALREALERAEYVGD